VPEKGLGGGPPVSQRKRWRLVYPGSPEADTFTSKELRDEFVEALRSAWAAGAPGSTGSLTVQVDEGQGWQTYEHINFATEEAA
jgi:hypothetical protein